MESVDLNDILTINPDSGWKIENVIYKDDQFHNEIVLSIRLKKHKGQTKSGIWLYKNNGVVWWRECSECGKRLLTSNPGKYCSDCGALMTLQEEPPEEDEDKEFYD